MKKKIGIFIMIMMIVAAVLPVIGSSPVQKIKVSNCVLNTEVRKPITFINYENYDTLDQNQSDYCGWAWVVWGSDFKLAQSFKPTLNMMSRVELLLYLVGIPGKLKISIRSDLSGSDLTSITVSGTNISGFQEHWAEFDFPDIGVEPEQTYYIIWSTIDTDSTNYFVWGYGDNNPYDRGDAYIYTPNDGWNINEGTTNHPDIDFCFKTYGVYNKPPDKPEPPTGKINGKKGEEYTYYASTTDQEGDDIFYLFDWGNDMTSFIMGPYPSGEEGNASNIWFDEGDYEIRVQAIDEFGAESEWSDPLVVSMPKSKSNMPFGFIFVFGFDVDVKIVQLDPGEDYVDLEVLSKPFYIWENEMQTRNPGEFIRLYNAKGLFLPILPICFGICDDWGIIG